jgi:hypothetical protein
VIFARASFTHGPASGLASKEVSPTGWHSHFRWSRSETWPQSSCLCHRGAALPGRLVLHEQAIR